MHGVCNDQESEALFYSQPYEGLWDGSVDGEKLPWGSLVSM